MGNLGYRQVVIPCQDQGQFCFFVVIQMNDLPAREVLAGKVIEDTLYLFVREGNVLSEALCNLRISLIVFGQPAQIALGRRKKLIKLTPFDKAFRIQEPVSRSISRLDRSLAFVHSKRDRNVL